MASELFCANILRTGQGIMSDSLGRKVDKGQTFTIEGATNKENLRCV